MAKAIYKRGIVRTIKYTAPEDADVAVDDIVLIIPAHDVKSRVGVARENIARATTGIVAVSGVFEFPKDPAAEIKAGQVVNFDPDDDGDAWVQAYNATAPENGIKGWGCAMTDAAAATTAIDVDISFPGVGDIDAGQ